jgi:hypothetical protein
MSQNKGRAAAERDASAFAADKKNGANVRRRRVTCYELERLQITQIGLGESGMVRAHCASARVKSELSDPVSVLLEATANAGRSGSPFLRPIWVEEAMHRAHTTLRLFQMLRLRQGEAIGPTHSIEAGLADELARGLRCLEVPSDNTIVLCSRLLRETVRNLVDLFGPAIGAVELATCIEHCNFPSYVRRAIVLLAAELVCNALIHGFPGRHRGQLRVELVRSLPGYARLTISDDGSGFRGPPWQKCCTVAGSLAELLCAELRYARLWGAVTVATVEFETTLLSC